MTAYHHPDLYQQLLRHLPEGVWVRDSKTGEILYHNQALESMFGEGSLVGRRVQELFAMFHPEDREDLRQSVERHMQGGMGKDCRLILPSGQVCWVNIRTFPLSSEEEGVVPDTHQSLRVAGVMTDVTARKDAESQMLDMANLDSLTGLANRTLFTRCIEQALSAPINDDHSVSVLFVDLDGFKRVNDNVGHAGGDILLKKMASRLVGLFGQDERCTLGRLGGDEFALLFRGSSQDADQAARQIIEALKKPFTVDGHSWSVGASIGIASCPEDSSLASALLRYADMAMYEDKQAGRNTCRRYHANLSDRVREKRSMEFSLHQAIARKEFALHYQPKIDLRTGNWTGVEALLRWNRPGIDGILPALFIPSLEESNLIVPLGEWVIEEACRQMQEWHDQGLPSVRVAVNVSAKQFFHVPSAAVLHPHPDFETVVRQNLRRYPAARLDIELTETVLMSNLVHATNALHRLRQLGVRCSVDDFGTGYSSLAYLKKFPLYAIKVDRLFVQGIPEKAEDVAIVSAIIRMAHSLGLRVIAEGVETEAQRELLGQMRCDEMQGYLVERALTPIDTTIWLRSHPQVVQQSIKDSGTSQG